MANVLNVCTPSSTFISTLAFAEWIMSTVVTFAPTLEALATLALAVYAYFQWKAIGRNNLLIKNQMDLQRERWNKEDEAQRLREALRYRFGVEPRDTEVVVWVANLGITSFFVDKVWLNMGQPLDSARRFLRQKGLPWQVVLSAGEAKQFVLPEGYSLGSPVQPDEKGMTRHACEIWLQIEHVAGSSKSDTFNFQVTLDKEERLAIFAGPYPDTSLGR